jgi:hypothetical protein
MTSSLFSNPQLFICKLVFVIVNLTAGRLAQNENGEEKSKRTEVKKGAGHCSKYIQIQMI